MDNANLLFSFTNYVQGYGANLQGEEQQLNLLGDIDIDALAPALTPSPRPSASSSLVSETAIRNPSRIYVIRGCQHHWEKLKGKPEEMQCELCGHYLTKMVFSCNSRCKVRICARCRKKIAPKRK
jgi:hypothetical protein